MSMAKTRAGVAGLALAMLLLTGGFGSTQESSIKSQADLGEYKVVSGISGNLSSVGSDTLNNLMTLWAENFKKFYPNVRVQIEGKGSATAPPALTNGTAQLGPMSRAMKETEIDSFERKFGYKP